MPVTVYRLNNDPILIASFSGTVDVRTMKTMYVQSTALIGERETVFRIMDFRRVSASFEDILAIFAAANGSILGSTSDNRIRPILVGDPQWSHSAQEAMTRTGGMELPVFSSMSDAMQYMQILLAGRAG